MREGGPEEDIAVIESQKENIQPLPGGRSVNRLVKSFSNGSTFKQRDELNKQRQSFEARLSEIDELDDPLDVFIDYIRWCHDKFPQGNNSESRLLEILEKCTSTFKDWSQYKNDPRYLKIWLEYGNYSDSPIEIFIYLAKKEIGKELALYYEEFAKLLELSQKYNDAKEVYEIGIAGSAKPLNRLIKSKDQFEKRKELYQVDNSDSNIKRVLTLKRGSLPTSNAGPEPLADPTNKRARFDVYNEDKALGMPKNLFNNKTTNKDIGSIQLRKKENIINAKPWDGELLFQQRPALKDSSDSSSKIPVYRDIEIPPEDVTQQNLHISEDDKVTSIITRPGKKPECVNLNMELLYPKSQEERSLLEVLIFSRRMKELKDKDDSDNSFIETKEDYEVSSPAPKSLNNTTCNDENDDDKQYTRNNDTYTIPLKDEDTTLSPSRVTPRSPTITFYSRMANGEIIDMFNSASTVNDNDNDDDDDHDEKSDGGNSTNYDGFVTETIYNNENDMKESDINLHKDYDEENFHESNKAREPIEPPVTTSTQQLQPSTGLTQTDSLDNTKPFLVDPLLESLREQLLSTIHPSIETYPGYNNTRTQFIEAIKKFRSLTDKDTKLVAKGSRGSIVNFCGDQIYSLKYELGQGGYGYVYLIENELGHLKALKAETKSSSWEFYILTQIHNRLKDDGLIRSRIIKPESLFLYKDECFLILNYLNQGTILDVVNYFHNKNQPVDEVLCIFITIELLKIIEKLHAVGIIHGDLKADNCMINFKHTKELLNNRPSSMDDSMWENERVVLIDFGRSIDLTLLPEGTEFKTSFKTDQQDCPQMNNNQSWSYEADYYGIAAIIHTLLFGEYIQINQLPNGKYKICKSLKRYWQTQLWTPLFDVMLNPYFNQVDKYPLVDELKYQRYKLQTWLQEHDYKLMQILADIEYDFRKFINI